LNDFEASFLKTIREFEAFDYKCEAFIKITRVFGDIFREMEASKRNLRLIQRWRGIFNGIEAFLKWCEVFSKNFRLFQINVGYFELFWGFLNTFSKKWRLLFRNVRLF
jgi:hypothetical protein